MKVKTFRDNRNWPSLEVERATQFWAENSGWPRWFAQNIVIWRKKNGLWWQTCASAGGHGA